MKTISKFILFTSFILFLNQPIKAQYLQFGVFADPQFSWFTSDTKRFTPNGLVFGFSAGFAFEKYFADRYAITSGASISSLGGNLKYNESGYTLETRDDVYNISAGSNVKFKGQYINVPLGLKFKTNEIGYSTYYAQLGINGNLKIKGAAWEEQNGIEKEVLDKSQTHFGFLSYMFGLGMQYSLGGPSSLQFGLNYSNGMTPAFKAGYGRISIGSLGFRVGLIF
jgi:hypothetical protein